ncbi:uncharacterized protein EAF02_007307 [Botrytis sinoallii]|uniref:uncharacterized protein n=1 Tax=Botrytis sinoallii TaxID=1463999 RepID=UPI0019029AFF|nr:uncharacterized protein EAF02_007307 [Botrytis sinoallii]KAF7880461.1 hypothetical protein EAF02_007307 [Botrytis sinoallii]
MDNEILGENGQVDPVFANLVNDHPPIRCQGCNMAHDYISFLKTLKNGTLKQMKSCKNCRERATAKRTIQREQSAMEIVPLGLLDPNLLLRRQAPLARPDPMHGRAPPLTPNPVPSAPVNRLPLRRARIDSFSDNEDIQSPQPVPPGSEEQLPMIAAGTRRGRQPRIARVREVPPAWMDVYDSNAPPNHYLGSMDKICEFCGAFHFEGEAIRARIGESTR